MVSARDILAVLSDGYFHSGEELAAQLDLSRSSIWKKLEGLRRNGLDVFAVRGKGYRLARPFELLSEASIRSHLSAESLQYLSLLETLWETESTNKHLMEEAQLGARSGNVCFAECQTQGRGRRGRSWVSPMGGNIFCSALWRFSSGPAQLSGLSLACAIAVARACQRMGITDVKVKWPNDILLRGRKLSGILLEMVGETTGPSYVVAGVGINMYIPKHVSKQIEQPWIDLDSALGRPVSRNKMAGVLLDELLQMFVQFDQHGFSYFHPQFQQMDFCHGQMVNLELPDRQIQGVVAGVDQYGALQLDRDGAIHHFQSGEISLRVL